MTYISLVLRLISSLFVHTTVKEMPLPGKISNVGWRAKLVKSVEATKEVARKFFNASTRKMTTSVKILI